MVFIILQGCFPCSNVSILRECECTNGTYGSYYDHKHYSCEARTPTLTYPLWTIYRQGIELPQNVEAVREPIYIVHPSTFFMLVT